MAKPKSRVTTGYNPSILGLKAERTRLEEAIFKQKLWRAGSFFVSSVNALGALYYGVPGGEQVIHEHDRGLHIDATQLGLGGGLFFVSVVGLIVAKHAGKQITANTPALNQVNRDLMHALPVNSMAMHTRKSRAA